MDLWRSLSGVVEVELTSADVASALQAINAAGIEIFGVRQKNDLTLYFTIRRSDYRKLRKLSQKRGEQLRFSSRTGVYWYLRQMLNRPVLLAGIGVILILTLYLPTHVYFIEVEGNMKVPTNLILKRAGECGIGFGSERREVRSERIKNALLQAVPELQWAGINTYGCRAVISVRERTEPDVQNDKSGVASIVAARDGIIREVTVKRGNRVCAVGQAVKSGQVLISGYTDCGICIRASKAEGEVYAETQRSVAALLPLEYETKGEILRQEKKYSLMIGKKQINFCKDSGISPTSCDKMYAVNYITLPGGFQLPIAIVSETLVYHDTQVSTTASEAAEMSISQFADRYLISLMNAGQIEQAQHSLTWEEGLCRLRADYRCVEMIGKLRLEENLGNYEAD